MTQGPPPATSTSHTYNDWSEFNLGGGLTVNSGWDATITAGGSWLIRAIWVDGDGHEGSAAIHPAPPSRLKLNISSIVKWTYDAPDGSLGAVNGADGSASNGLGDIYNSYSDTYNSLAWGQMSGSHIKNFPSGNGLVEFTVNQSGYGHISINPLRRGGNLGLQHTVGVAQDDRGVAIVRPTARGEVIHADGSVEGDTIWTLETEDPDGGAPFHYTATCHFVPLLTGSWSMYPSSSWPHPNVEIKWEGLGASYDYTPIYTFDESNTGVYLRRENPVNTGGPTSSTLKITAKDLGDGADAANTYTLHYHKPGDNWRRTGGYFHFEFTGEKLDALTRLPGPSTLSASTSKTGTLTSTDEIDISGGFTYKPSESTLEMPVAIGYKHSYSQSVSVTRSVEVTGGWPTGGVIAYPLIAIVTKYDKGLIDKYDEDGLLSKDVYATQHKAEDVDYVLIMRVYDSSGNLVYDSSALQAG